MKSVYRNILSQVGKGEKCLAVLIDPDKMELNNILAFVKKVNASIATHIFVGGSNVKDKVTEDLVHEIKKHTKLPIVLFPGDVSQITPEANALLYLSLISGRNSDYLIGKHVESVSKLRHSELEVIPTGSILIENGKETAVERVSETLPMSRLNIQDVVDTALAGELLGLQLVYLEAGSGATHPVERKMISEVKKALNIPVVVGGGIRTKQQLNEAYTAGADLVVIGTAIEEDESFFNQLN
jgi:putative glycerol-1-phosphate prenyltransferase